MKDAKSSEHRQFTRAPITLSIKAAESGSEIELDLIVKDLSEGGIFIRCPLLWDPGEVFDLSFSLPGYSEVIHAKGVVMRAEDKYLLFSEQDHDDPIPGMGIQFQSISEEDKEKIRNFVTSASK